MLSIRDVRRKTEKIPVMMTDSPWLPDKNMLFSDLGQLHKVLGKPKERFFSIKTLQKTAQLICPRKHDADSISEAMQLAVNRLGANIWAVTAAHLYGLTKESKEKSFAERRELAREACGVASHDTFRTGDEIRIKEDLAEALLELVKEAQEKQGQSDTEADAATNRPSTHGDNSERQQPATTPSQFAKSIAPRQKSDRFQVGNLSNSIFEDIRELCTHGFGPASYRHAPTLVRIAYEYVHLEKQNELGTDFLEVFLLAMIHQLDDKEHIQGAVELLGLGSFRGLSLNKRRDRAAPHFGYNNAREFWASHQEPQEPSILQDVAKHCTKFATDIGFGKG